MKLIKCATVLAVLLLNTTCVEKEDDKNRLEMPNFRASSDALLSKFGGDSSAVGDSYTGLMKDGKYDGRGVLTKRNKDRYEGVFAAGLLEGTGLFVGADGDSYEGEFKAGIPSGKGVKETNTGDIYTGNFNRGNLEGEGTYTQLGGIKYSGAFQNLRPHGNGVLTLENGDVYEGEFQRGAFHGTGTLTLKVAREDGTKIQKGNWAMGRFIDPLVPVNPLEVESFIDDQPKLLQAQIESLKPRTPNQTNMYFLGVAGDGNMEVFRREVQSIAKQFDRDFNTAGHSIKLVNSADSTATLPMANQLSMQRALDAIAKQMDKQTDILFLFMTSHGSREHEFVLDHPHADIKDLPAKTLATMLERTGIQHKVIVVSACYSGGFIAPLENEHHLILTAARADRNSFGCATENDFTYFGRAFFKETLPKSASFQDAFVKAKVLITEWEARDFAVAKMQKDYLEARRTRLKISPPSANPVASLQKVGSAIMNAVRNLGDPEADVAQGTEGEGQPSLPQIFVGKKIEPVLESWWKARQSVIKTAVDAHK